jgi:hypothetical protein
MLRSRATSPVLLVWIQEKQVRDNGNRYTLLYKGEEHFGPCLLSDLNSRRKTGAVGLSYVGFVKYVTGYMQT